MDLLAFHSDIFNLILTSLRLEDKVKLYCLSKAYRERLQKKWDLGLQKYPPLSSEERGKLKKNHIRDKFTSNYMNYMAQRYNRMSLYTCTFNCYTEVNIAIKSIIYSTNNLNGVFEVVHVPSHIRPYYWKEIFNNLNEYLKKKNRPLIKEKNINSKGLAITDIPYLKYREPCIERAEELVEEFKFNNKVNKYNHRMKKMELKLFKTKGKKKALA